MDLKTFEFPKITGVDIVFPILQADKKLLKEAKERGFYNGNTPYNKLFATLFFRGGKVKFKKKVDLDYRNRAWAYCCAFMNSGEPKHEEKEAICALIMSEILEPKLTK